VLAAHYVAVGASVLVPRSFTVRCRRRSVREKSLFSLMRLRRGRRTCTL